MNDEVDRRIVEMQFNNKDFLNKIRATVNALNELDEAMEMTNAGAAGDQMAAFAKVTSKSMEKVNDSVETVRASFSALQVVGMTVLSELTRAAMSTGVKIYNALLGQIISGGKARSMKIQKAKFMLEGLGIDWNEISEDINYGVQDTAYGLDAAANAASQLSASGVHVGDDMKTALRGISGVAAMTSRSYEEVAHVFTRVAGQGRVMAIDLNSIAAYGLNAAQSLAEYFNKLYNTSEYTEARIREMVSRGQIDFHTFAEAMDDAFGTHAKEANKTFTGALENIQAALSRIGQKFADPVYQGMIPIFNGIRESINMANRALEPLYNNFSAFARVASNSLTNILKSEGFLRLVVVIASNLYSYIRPLFGALNNLGIGRWNNVAEFLLSLSHYLERFQIYGENAVRLQYIFEFIGESIKTIFIYIGYIKNAVSPITNLILAVVQKIFGRTNTLFRVLNSINPVLRIIGYYASQLIKLGLEKLITGIANIISRIDWNAVLNGLASAVAYLIDLGRIIFNLSVEYLPKLINLFGYLPTVIKFVKNVASAIVNAAHIVGVVVGTAFAFIADKYQIVRDFFSHFARQNEEAVTNVVDTANRFVHETARIEEEEAKVGRDNRKRAERNAREDARATREAGKPARQDDKPVEVTHVKPVVDEVAEDLEEAKKEIEQVNEAVEEDAEKITDLGRETEDTVEETEKRFSRRLNKLNGIFGVILRVIRESGYATLETQRGVAGVFAAITHGVEFIYTMIKEIIDYLIETVKELWESIPIVVKILTPVLVVLYIALKVFFARLMAIPNLINSISSYFRTANSYQVLAGIGDMFKDIGIFLLALSASFALFAIVVDRLDPKTFAKVIRTLREFFTWVGRLVYTILFVVGAIKVLETIPTYIAAIKGNVRLMFGRELANTAIAVQLMIFAISALLISFAVSFKILYDIVSKSEHPILQCGAVLGIFILLMGTVFTFIAGSMVMVNLLGMQAKSTSMSTATLGGFAALFSKQPKDFASIENRLERNNPLFGVFLMIAGIAGLMIALSIAFKIMDTMTPGSLWNSFLVTISTLALVTVMIGLLLRFTGHYERETKKGMIRFDTQDNSSAAAQSVSRMISSIAGLILSMSISFAILDKLDTGRLWRSFGVVALLSAIVLGILVALIAVSARLMKNTSLLDNNAQKSMAMFNSIALMIAGLSSLIFSIAIAMRILDDVEDLESAGGAMIGIILVVMACVAGLMVLNNALSGINKGIDNDAFSSMGKMFLGLSAFVTILAIAIGGLALFPTEQVLPIVISLAGIFVAIGFLVGMIAVAMNVMNKGTGAQFLKFIGILAGLLAVIALISTVVVVAAKFISGIDASSIYSAIGAVAAIFALLLAIGAVMVGIGALFDSFPVLWGFIVSGLVIFMGVLGAIIVAMAGISVAIDMLTDTFNKLSTVDFSFVMPFLRAMQALLTGIAALFIASNINVLSLLGFALGLKLLVGALTVAQTLDSEAVEAAGKSIAAFIVSISSAFENASDFLKIFGIIILAATAIVVLSAAITGAGLALILGVGALILVGAMLSKAGESIRDGLLLFVDIIVDMTNKMTENLEAFGGGLLMLVGVGLLLVIIGVTMLLGSATLAVAGFILLVAANTIKNGVYALVDTMSDCGAKIAEDVALFFGSMVLLVVTGLLLSIAGVSMLAGSLIMLLAMLALAGASWAFKETVDNICDSGERLINFINDYLGINLTEIFGNLGSVIEEATELGSNIVSGIVDGLNGGRTLLMGAGSALWTWIRDQFTSDAEINSPSRVAMQWGNYITEGLTGGINDGERSVKKSMTKLANAGDKAFCDTLGINSPSKVFHDHGLDETDGLTEGVEEGSEEYLSTMYNMGSRSVERYNEGVESVEPEPPIEEEDVTDEHWYTGILDFFRNIGANISGAFDLSSIREKFAGIRDIISGVFSGDIDISDIGSLLSERLPDLFGDGGILAGTSFGENLVGNIMSYRSQMEEAGRELRNSFNDAFGGGHEILSGALFRQAARYAETGNQNDYMNIQRMLDANPNSLYHTVEDVMKAYEDTMSRYDQIDYDEIMNTTMDQTGAGDSGGLSTSSAMASGAQDSMNRSVINSNNTTTTTNNYNYTQNNYSPEALDRIDIYRQTEVALGLFGAWDRQQ